MSKEYSLESRCFYFANQRSFRGRQQTVPREKCDKPGDLERSLKIGRLPAAPM